LQAAIKLDHLVMVQCSNCDHVEHLGCMGLTRACHRRLAAETAIKAGYPVVPVAGTSASGSAPAVGTVPSLLCIECAADAKAEAKLVAREGKKAAKAAERKKKKAAAASSSVDTGEESTRSAGTAGESEEEAECEECEQPCDGLEMFQCANCEGWVHLGCILEEDLPVRPRRRRLVVPKLRSSSGTFISDRSEPHCSIGASESQRANAPGAGLGP